MTVIVCSRAARLTLALTASLAIPALALAGCTRSAAPAPAAQVHAASSRRPVLACARLSALRLPDAAVDIARADTTGTFTIPPGQRGTGRRIRGLPPFCQVAVTETNPPATDSVHIEVWLPLDGWNGRFEGVGGGGFVSGISWYPLASALTARFAAASTDTGHPASQANGSFALAPGGGTNWPAITDFAYRGIHEMTVTAKTVTHAFYGTGPRYSYFSGCSTGGRQGLMEAQRYPHDYNGILAGSPAIDWSRVMVAQIWPEFVMKELRDYLPPCKFAAFRAAAVAACDTLDGVADGVIGNLAACHFSPYRLVGTRTRCGTITATDARAVALILAGEHTRLRSGRFLWYGLEPGTDFAALARTVTAHGATTPEPVSFTTGWFRYWLTRDPGFDWRTLTVPALDHFFALSVRRFALLETGNPDLAAFRRAGGKLIIWTGLSDQLIFPQGIIRYYRRVERAMGGQAQARSFARLFLAPGAGHCGGDSAGPVPADPFAALANWVEKGAAPATIPAARQGRPAREGRPATAAQTRPLCAYPDVAVYDGSGTALRAADFSCAAGYPRPGSTRDAG